MVLAVLVAMALWWSYSGDADIPTWWRGAGLLALALPHAPVLALEYALLARYGLARGITPPEERIKPRLLLRAWLDEVLTAWRVFGWWQPFRAQTEPDITGASGRRGVVLVHGYFCNRGLWTPWLRLMRTRGLNCKAITLAPSFGDIDDMTSRLDAAIEALRLHTGHPPWVVAHSMGGLVLRAWMARSPDADRRVHRLVTIATPHQGTWMARFARGANGRQMRVGAPWLAELAQQETPARRARFVCFHGDADAIVFPEHHARLAGADNRRVPGVGHVGMVYRPEVMGWLLAELQRDNP